VKSTCKSHVIRIALGLLLFAVVGGVGKYLLTPESFGQYGHYRADAIEEEANRDIRHWTNASCFSCHEYEADIHLKGRHKTISGSLLLVIPAGADILKMPEQIAGIRDKDWDISNQILLSLSTSPSALDAVPVLWPTNANTRCRTATTGHGWNATSKILMMKSMWIHPTAGWRAIKPPARTWTNRSEIHFSCPNSATCARTPPVFRSARWAPLSARRTDLF
jgi:hypothetical protein